MKKVKILYWTFTALFLAFMLVSALSQVIPSKGTEEIMNALRMPLYILPFLGIAKLLAIVVILAPGFVKIKQWAYAGLMFDFVGATYCMIAVGSTIDKWGFMIVPILLCVLSYRFYEQKLALQAGN